MTMQHNKYYPKWLVDDLLVIGAEGEGENPPAEGSDDPPAGDADSQGASSDSQDPPDGDDDDDIADDDPAKGLKTALRAERRKAKALERENRQFKAAQEEAALKDASELEKAQAKLTKAEERTKTLASGLLTRDLNAAIRAEAEKMGFVDVDDALAGVDRAQLKFTQDDEDPTDISIDIRTVTAQVKSLASRKPHFIKTGTTDGQPTGSQFGGSKQKQSSTADDLKALYPGL
jgi:hypothetical protein